MEDKQPLNESVKPSANDLRAEDDFVLPLAPADMPLRADNDVDPKVIEQQIAYFQQKVVQQPGFYEGRKMENFVPFVWRD
jgi:hypothetical protein